MCVYYVLFLCLLLILVYFALQDPSKQFALVREHIARLRFNAVWAMSEIVIFVERNLGFESEYHERELSSIENVVFYREPGSDRVGCLTTNESKHAMCALLNAMLREGRVSVRQPIVSRDSTALRVKLKEQLGVYSYQFKQAANTFGKDSVAISGKVGGMKDDICICLQLGVLYTSPRK